MWIRNIPLLFAMYMLMALPTDAFAMWGTGMWGGAQHCPTEPGMSAEAERQLDALEALSELRDETKDLVEDLNDQILDLESEIDARGRQLEGFINGPQLDFIIGHISSGAYCSEYDFGDGTPYIPKGTLDRGSGFDSNRNPDGYGSDSYGGFPIESMSPDEWRQACNPNKAGGVHARYVCTRFKVQGARGSGCESTLSRLPDLYRRLNDLQDQLADAEFDLERLERQVESHRKKFRREIRKTEADCPECSYSRARRSSRGSGQGSSLLDTIGNIGLGLVGMGLSYHGHKKTVEANASLGYPTQGMPGFGAPYLYAGLYGAIAGGAAQGGFQCSPGMGGGGVMGYPPGIFGGLPGMSFPGMGFPGMGGMAGIMFPGMMPGMGGMYPGMGGMMPGMGGMFPGMGGMFPGMGFPGIGGYGGIGGMMPGMGGMFPGMGGMGGIGGMPGMGGMFPGMGGMGGIFPGMGGMMPGMGGMFPGMGGIGGIGGMPGMGGMFPGMGGMFPGMGGIGGIGGMPGMGGMGDPQMQQQMMQLQMQQYQMMMQQQQRYAEDMMNRQRVVSGLQQELQTLMYRLQQAQMGVIGGGGPSMGPIFPGGAMPGGGVGSPSPTPGVAPGVR